MTTTQLKSQPGNSKTTRPTASLRALTSLRNRIRRYFLVDGIVAVGFALCWVLLATFVLDFSLKLPQGVRVILLGAVLLYVTSVIIRRLIQPGQVPLSPEDLALLVERDNPELKQSLVTAIQLSAPGKSSSGWVSDQLLESVVIDVEQKISSLSVRRVLKLKRLYRSIFLLFLLGGVFVVAAGARSDHAGIWFRRVFLLSSERWPKVVELALVTPREPVVQLAMGESLPVEVAVKRGSPSSVEIRYGSDSRNSRVDVMREAPGGNFRKVFEHVSRPFQFQVRGGDDELETVQVEVQIRPKVSEVHVWCEYPGYTGKPSTLELEPILNGNLKVPVGTRVRYRAYSNVRVEQAFFSSISKAAEIAARERAADEARSASSESAEASEAGNGKASDVWPPTDSGEFESLTVEAAPALLPEGSTRDEREVDAATSAALAERSSFSGAFTVEGDGHYRFHLLGENGLVNRSPVRFRIQAIRDQKPALRLLKPVKANEEVSPEAEVKVAIQARDDYGIRDGFLRGVHFGEGDEAERVLEIPLPSFAQPDPAEAVLEQTAELTLSMSEMKAVKGDRIQYYAEASDHGGNRGESEKYVLHVVSKDQIMRILQSELMVVKDQVHTVMRQQESARKDLDTFSREAVLKEKLDEADAGKLARHRQNQQRVTRGVDRAANEIRRVLEKMTSNRVGEQKERDWIDRIRQELSAVAEEKSKRLENQIEALRETKDPDQLSPVLGAQKEIERDLSALALRLTEYGDINAIKQQWHEILRRQLEIKQRVIEEIRRQSGTQ